jgi:hypothetical protein
MATSDSEYENRRFVFLRRFRDLPDALLFESLLESAGIECFLADENTIRMDWFWSNLLGGVKLCVRQVDFLPASSLLDQSHPEKIEVEGVGEYQQPRCPICQSLEISFQGLHKPVDFIRFLLGGPRPLHRSLWECDSCGHQWPESAEKPPADFLISASSILLLVIAFQTAAGMLFSVINAVRIATSQ